MRLRGFAAVAVGAALVLVGIAAAVDEPLRRYLERRINASLSGYTVSIGALDLQLLGLAVELE